MILRIWRCPVAEDDVEPFDAFMRENLFPRLAESTACLSVTTAVDRSTTPPEVVAVSTWRSRDALDAFIGTDHEDGVFLPDAKRFLAGEPHVVHLDVLGHGSWDGG